MSGEQSTAQEDLVQALAELTQARAGYDEVHEIAEARRKDEASALARLKKAQDVFDLAVAKIKTNAPTFSKWDQQSIRQRPSEART